MKKIFISFLSFASLLFTSILYSQAPQSLNYQAIARNTNGTVVYRQFISVEISIRDGSPSAPIVYQEIDTTTTNQFGLFTVAIGTGQLQSGSFSSIHWPTGNKYLQVGFDPTGGQNFTIMGVSELLSVPYAFYTNKADTANIAISIAGGNIFTHYIGQLYGGGIVVAVWKDTSGVERGLIISLTDVGANIMWSNVTDTLIGASAEDPSNGSGNTIAIIGQAGQTSSAALLCQSYASGGYNDWYLPSIGELQQCYSAAMIVNQVLGNTNGVQLIISNGAPNPALYWSSTESDITDAWVEALGGAVRMDKNNTALIRIRAVRRY